MSRHDMARHVSADQLERGRQNIAALRAQHEYDTQFSYERQNDMTEKSHTGIKRARLRTDDAKSAVGALNRKLDEGLDEVRLAFQREEQAGRAKNADRADDARRAPALDNPRSVR